MGAPVQVPDHLPRQLTSFVGRERELRELRELLDRGRLLTLTGPGGSGKTRLGLELAAEVRDGFPDGVYFVALAPVGRPDLVLSSIAQGIGLRDVGDRPLPERLRSHLENARVLILLDNFEHLIAAAPAVAQILQATAAPRIVVTSRAPLHVSGEQEYEVPPLRVPGPQWATPAAVAGCESVRLFTERARAVRPGFVLDESNAELPPVACAPWEASTWCARTVMWRRAGPRPAPAACSITCSSCLEEPGAVTYRWPQPTPGEIMGW